MAGANFGFVGPTWADAGVFDMKRSEVAFMLS
jgi:hypothetical protein